jgi:hypothetical protein
MSEKSLPNSEPSAGSAMDNSAEAPSQVDERKLLRALIDLFSEEEIRRLCFELRLQYDNLPGQDKIAKTRALVIYFMNRHRMSVLVEAFRGARPFVNLADIALEPDEEELPPPVRQRGESRESDAEGKVSDTMIASKSFAALVRVMAQPAMYAAMQSFRDTFQASSDQIGMMNDYKLVHDLLQELETAYAVIAMDLKYLPERMEMWERLSYNEPALSSKIEEILTVMNQGTFAAEEERWVKMLTTAGEKVRLGIEDLELAPLKSGAKLINQIINRQPSLFNAQLVTTARGLRLDALEQAMTTICNTLIEKNIGLESLVQEIKAGVDALDGLHDRMNQFVDKHNEWQSFDDELRRAESELQFDVEVFIFTWEMILPMAEELIQKDDADWVPRLQKGLTKLNEATTDAPEKIGPFFNRFRSEVGRRFREVDMQLLTLCQDLQRVGEQLDLLLRSFK